MIRGFLDWRWTPGTAFWRRVTPPPSIVARLHHEINALLSQPKSVQLLKKAGFQLQPMSQNNFAELIAIERPHWGALIAARHLSLLDD